MTEVFGDYHVLSPGMKEVYSLNGFSPTMDRATQKRAMNTIKLLQEQWTL